MRTKRAMRHSLSLVAVVTLALLMTAGVTRAADSKKPNILILWGDDIGYWNISAYNQGMMGYKTPNIDRIAKEGALFTDWYGQQSCTAGRSCFITGQSGFRTGMLKVGLPGAKEGLQARDVTIAELLKAQGYITGQFGKNHLGDRDEHLPTAHGFGEFYGSLYHLNAEEEPENPDYFKDPEMMKKYATRGVLHTWANPDGTQKIELTGPLNKKRMETVDDEFTKEALRFMTDAKKADKPFFLWWNATRMHIWTHLKPEMGRQDRPRHLSRWHGRARCDVGEILDKLKELGLEDNTIVMYSTDNGAEKFSWPDGGTSPFRNEKASNWEGAYRVPCAIRWPGVIKPGTVINDIFSHEDMLPTLLAAAGVPDVKEQLLKGMKVGDKTFKVHLDGYNLTDALAGKSPSPRKEFFYFNDDGSLVGAALQPMQDRLRRTARDTAWMSGRIPSCRCVSRSSSTCAPIRSRPPTTRASTTGSGGWITPSCSCRRSNTSGNSSPRSRNSRRARKPAASRSTTRCKVCSTLRKPPATNRGREEGLTPHYMHRQDSISCQTGPKSVRLWQCQPVTRDLQGLPPEKGNNEN